MSLGNYPVYQASKGDKEGEKKRERGLGKQGRDMPLTLFPSPLLPPTSFAPARQTT